MTDEVKVLSDDEVAEIEAQLATIIDPLPPVQRAVALCCTARAAWVDRNKWQQTAETLSEENTTLREQLAHAQRELETAKLGRSPAWACAICGQFCVNSDELKKHECGMPYRVLRYGDGYEASMWARSGAGGHFWTPLLATGYWAEPESFSTGVVKGLHLLNTHEEAQRAIERAQLLNTNERILNIANPTSDPKT